MANDLLTRYKAMKDFTAGYKATDPFRAAGGLRIKLSLCVLSSNPSFCLHKNLPVQQLPSAAPSGAVFEKSACPFAEPKGASGSWAEPYFACFLRCKKGFAYPPGILDRVFTGKRKEKRILRSILYKQIKVYTTICQQKD